MAKKSLQDLTKPELYERAQKADVPGRSEMTREQLIKSLSNGQSEKRPKKSRKRPKRRPPSAPATVTNLLEALKASVDQTRAKRTA